MSFYKFDLPTISNYSHGPSGQWNSTVVSVGGLDIYFSYSTPVAFRGRGHGLTVRENNWGPTTGKHLNWIDGGDKKSRVSSAEFERLMQLALNGDSDE